MSKHYRPGVIWFTGLPCAGKSTLARLTALGLMELGLRICLLDGDDLRLGLNKDLGFSRADRAESVRRTAEVARLMVDCGIVAICALVSPFDAERRRARELFEHHEFVEVFVDTPLETCIARDVKSLYRRAILGELQDVTGIDQIYEAPQNAEIVVKTEQDAAEAIATQIILNVLTRLMA
jgi:bifunctional enzyme CysN/CysC